MKDGTDVQVSYRSNADKRKQERKARRAAVAAEREARGEFEPEEVAWRAQLASAADASEREEMLLGEVMP